LKVRASVRCIVWTIGVLTVATIGATIGALPALAQEPAQPGDRSLVPETQLTPEESALVGDALVFDPAALATPPKKPLRLPGTSGNGFDITRTEKFDGSATVVVKQPLQTEWSNSVGADLGPSRADGGSAFDRPLPTARDSTSTGAAWASFGVTNVGSVDARVDPSNEQGKLGTTFRQSIPLGRQFAVTVQDTYSVTGTLSQPSAAAGDVPLMALPPAVAPTSPEVYGNERAVKFNILPTGTTLGAGVTTASNDPVTHNTFSAEQKLYGPLQVTTAVTDFGQTTINKKISAGFKLHW
jgi:hypothetical protein